MTWRTALAPLSIRTFRLLLFGRLADNVAHAIAPIAVAFAVLDLGGSASELGMVLACRAVPLIVLVLLGGVIADRLPRHLVLVGANVVGAVTQAAVAVLLLTGSAEIWSIALLEVVNGAASAFLFPAASGLTQQAVPVGQLQPANALLRVAHNMAFITGAAGGGLLVAAFGSGWAFAVDSGLYLAGAVMLARLPLSGTDRVEPSNTLRELREGWTEFVSRTWVWAVVVAFSVVNAALGAGLATLGPVVADETIGRSQWGTVLGAQAVGMLAGGLVALRSTWSRPLFVGLLLVGLEAPLLLVLGLHPQVLLLVGVAFLSGLGIEIFQVAWDVSVQTHVPPDRLSRVYAYDWFGSLAFMPLGQLIAGPLAAVIGVRETIVGSGVVVLVAVLLAASVPSVRGMRREAVAGEPAPAAVTA